MKVEVIIVNYNAGAALLQAVGSAIACEAVVRVVVVDNASSDGSISALRSRPDFADKLCLIENVRNLGFAVACNQGVAETSQPYLLYLNPDCVLTSEALAALLTAIKADPHAGMVGPVLRYPDGTIQEGGRRAAPTPWRSFVRASGLHRFSRFCPRLFADFVLSQNVPSREASEVDAISGACMLVRRSALEVVGPLDEGYFLHCEDLDWCMRFRLGGWKILFVPQASVTHEKGVCSVSRPVFVAWHKHHGMVRFYRKFYASRHPMVFRGLLIFGVWVHFLVKMPLAVWRALR